jgi:hypothetical protein
MAGFVMLGVAAVAAVVGLVSLAGGGDQANAAPAASSSAASSSSPAPPSGLAMAPSAPAAAPRAPAAPAPGAPPPPISVPAQPPAAAQPPPAGPPPAAAPTVKPLPGAGLPPANRSSGRSGQDTPKSRSTARAPVRVYNNSTVRDLAQQAAADFRDSGWRVDEVGNYPNGTIGTSTVYYRPGTGEQAAAQSLASGFGLRAAPRFAGIENATPGLIVIVTRDYQRR